MIYIERKKTILAYVRSYFGPSFRVLVLFLFLFRIN